MPNLISVTGVTTTHDETAGLQNSFVTPTPTGDADDNDIVVASLPLEFSSRLTVLEADPLGAIGAALSGYDGTNIDEDEELNVLTVDATGTISNLAFVDANGDPLDGLDSGLTTVDGNTIFLYTDPDNDNIVLGREGDETAANEEGNIVIAIYLEENEDLTAAKIWTVQYEPTISHPDTGDPDDAVNLDDKLFVAATQDLKLDASNAPSGQNLFIMFGDGNITDGDAEVGVVATGKNPINQSDDPSAITSGDTVNTSKAGGPTTFGVDNQMLNEGEGIYFTFVSGPDPEYTVPDLTPGEADIEANIVFTALQDSRGASFDVVQLQAGKTAVVTLTAYANSDLDPSGENFVDAFANDTTVDISSVDVFDFDGGGEVVILDNEDGTFTISGIEAGDTINYFTDGDHNRILIENDGDGRGKDSADFDIGGFTLLKVTNEVAEVGDKVFFEDDGPAVELLPAAILEKVYLFDGNTDEAGNFEGNGDNLSTNVDPQEGTGLPDDDAPADGSPTSVTIDLSGYFPSFETPGNDDPASSSTTFSLGLVVGSSVLVDEDVEATSGGVPVVWKEVTPDTEYAGVIYLNNAGGTETEIFSISVNSTTAVVTFSQSGPLDHARTDTDGPYTTDILTLTGAQISIAQTTTVTDADGDTATVTETVTLGNDVFHIGDDGPQIDIELSGADLRTDDRSLTGGSGLPDAGTNTDTDTLTTVVTDNTSAGADGQDSLVYSLGVKSAGVDSGVDDVATGYGIFLFLESGVVVGRVGSDDVTPNAAGAIAFQVSVNGTSGAVTLDQDRAIEHGTDATNAGSPDYYTTDVETLTADTVTLTATLKDGDLDVATDTENIGDKLGFTDDGPDVTFSNLVGTVTTTPQIAFWDENAGADRLGTLTVMASDTFGMVTADGDASTGTVDFDSETGMGTLTADFDNDPDSGVDGNETIGFSLSVNDDGTYAFELDEVAQPVVTLSTDEGQLPAGGPDPVQTLSFLDGPDFVFFAVDADTAEAGDAFGPTNIVDAIDSGEPDLTEAQLEERAAPPIGNNTFPFIREDILMNVSTSGIGVNNNVLQGEDLPGDDPGTINSFDSGAFDESFVINPEPLASEIKVFVSKTAGGFLPPNDDGSLNGTPAKTDYLYYNVYDELGNSSTDPIRVNFEDLTDEGSLWSFTVDAGSVPGDSIDAVQFTMGFGAIKIPKIEVVVSGDAPPNDIFLDFSATLTDADGDSATTAFAVDLVGGDIISDEEMLDYTLVDAGPGPDAFDVDVLVAGNYLVQGFDPDPGDDELYDQLYLLNGTTYELNTGDFGAGDSGTDDSKIIAGEAVIIVEDATLSDIDITIA